MKKFYTIENGLPVLGEGEVVPKGATEFVLNEEPDVLAQAQQRENVLIQKNNELAALKQNLSDIDIKRVRPLAEGDNEYLAQLNSEAETLRNQVRTLIAELED